MFKSGGKHYMENYQSVSLLIQFLKIVTVMEMQPFPKIRDRVENKICCEDGWIYMEHLHGFTKVF